MAEIHGLGIGHQLPLHGRIVMDTVRLDHLHQGIQLIQAQANGGLKVLGNLLAHTGHIQRPHLVDGARALGAHVERQEGKDKNTQKRHSHQTRDQEACRFVFHAPFSSWKVRMAWMVR